MNFNSRLKFFNLFSDYDLTSINQKLESAFDDATKVINTFIKDDLIFYKLIGEIFSPENEKAIFNLNKELKDNLCNIDVEILNESELGRVKGGFTSSGTDNKESIYLNYSFINKADFKEIRNVLLEEFGHYIDFRVNGLKDTFGDEGAKFASHLLGIELDPVELVQNDQRYIEVKNERILIEASAKNFIEISSIAGKIRHESSGYGVSLSDDGKTLAFGAIHSKGHGTARVFSYDSNSKSWSQIGNDLDGEFTSDWAGYSVSLSADGKVVAVGAFLNDGIGKSRPNSGSVRVYKYNDQQKQYLRIGRDIDGKNNGDKSGIAVSLSSDGEFLAVGASENNDGGNKSGHVAVYKYNSGNNSWSRYGNTIAGEGSNLYTGSSVSISADGQRIAIGGRGARVYEFNSGTNSWTKLGSNFAAAGFDKVSISADGNRIAIGSDYVHVYQYNSGSNTWTKLGDNVYGASVNSLSLSSDGKRVAFGVTSSNNNQGSSSLYEYNSGSNSWIKLGDDIPGEESGDEFGNSISLSSVGAFSAAVAILSSNSRIVKFLSPQLFTSSLDKKDNFLVISSLN